MKLQSGNVTVEDTLDRIVKRQNGIECGCKKQFAFPVRYVCGDGFQQTKYACLCGNRICVTVKRYEDDLMMLEDDE